MRSFRFAGWFCPIVRWEIVSMQYVRDHWGLEVQSSDESGRTWECRHDDVIQLIVQRSCNWYLWHSSWSLSPMMNCVIPVIVFQSIFVHNETLFKRRRHSWTFSWRAGRFLWIRVFPLSISDVPQTDDLQIICIIWSSIVRSTSDDRSGSLYDCSCQLHDISTLCHLDNLHWCTSSEKKISWMIIWHCSDLIIFKYYPIYCVCKYRQKFMSLGIML